MMPIARVDRCMSCHAGINKAGFEDQPNPWKTHPRRELYLGKHPPEKFGCTPCHGGQGPAVVLLHGFGDTGDMWAPVAAALVKTHTVVVPDLRGMGLSDHPDTGYTKANEARDIAGVMDALKIAKADLITHDIGNMVGYALAAQYPTRGDPDSKHCETQTETGPRTG